MHIYEWVEKNDSAFLCDSGYESVVSIILIIWERVRNARSRAWQPLAPGNYTQAGKLQGSPLTFIPCYF